MSDEELLRMSFVEHLTELRARLIRALAGFGAAFAVSLTFTSALWEFVKGPAAAALRANGFPEHLFVFDPMDVPQIIWMKLPVVCAIFLGAPWMLYQLWAFIAPGLYRHERRWAGPLLVGSSGLFILGGVFAYFVAFRYGLTFLLSVAKAQGLVSQVPVDVYFNLFVDVVLGIGVLFELPVIIFLLTALGVVTPGFLLRHSRYAILTIFVVAAVVTPSTDVFNLILFAMPMCALFYLGVGVSWAFLLRRDGRAFPWTTVLAAGGAAAAAGGAWWAYRRRQEK